MPGNQQDYPFEDCRVNHRACGADFLLRGISPLEERDRPAWLYGDAADKISLLLGLANKLSVYGHAWLCDQLFGRFELFKLPSTVIPLNVNSARDQILKWMPDCNAEGIASTWQLPTLDEELHWSSTLVERAARTETGMYKHTSSAEVAYILKRVEEDKAARLTEMVRAAKAGKGKGKPRMKFLPMAVARHRPQKGLPRKNLPGIALPG